MKKTFVALLVLAAAPLMGNPENSTGALQENPPQHSLLGMGLAEAKRTDFFVWFHLTKVGEETTPEKRVVVIFKPDGEAFHKLVTVRTVLDNHERIVRMELLLARSFINGQAMFANDIAKSFLFDATSMADEDAVKSLADDISSNRSLNERVITVKPLPSPPEHPGPAYLTYLGRQRLYSERLSNSALSLENFKQGDDDWLRIALSLGT